MTLPTFWPLFWSAMSPLERWLGCAAGRAPPRTAREPESSEALPDTIRLRICLSVLGHRRHTGVVIEASDVGRDERGEHLSNSIRRRSERYCCRIGPPCNERAEEFEACWNAFRRSSACDVRRSIVSSEANGPTVTCTG